MNGGSSGSAFGHERDRGVAYRGRDIVEAGGRDLQHAHAGEPGRRGSEAAAGRAGERRGGAGQGRAERVDDVAVDVTEEPQRHVPAGRPDGAKALAASEHEGAQALPRLLVGPGGHEQAHRAAGSGAVVESVAPGARALAQHGNGALERPAGTHDAPFERERLTRFERVRVTRRGTAQRVESHVGQFLHHPADPLGHVRHGLARPAHLGSGVVWTL